MNEHEKPQIDFMHKLARQIVERRNLVFLFVILAAISPKRLARDVVEILSSCAI